jgi:hypothetical protein
MRATLRGRGSFLTHSRTRWNSTYAMIQRACEPLSQTVREVGDLPELSSEEWVLLEVVGQVLSGFDKATRWLSASNYPTLNKAVKVYDYLIGDLESFLGRCNNEEEEGRRKAAIIDRCDATNKRVLKAAMEAAHTKLGGYYSLRHPSWPVRSLDDSRSKLQDRLTTTKRTSGDQSVLRKPRTLWCKPLERTGQQRWQRLHSPAKPAASRTSLTSWMRYGSRKGSNAVWRRITSCKDTWRRPPSTTQTSWREAAHA